MLTLATCVLVAATVVFFLAAPYIIDLYTTGSHGAEIVTERQVATFLLRLFSPQLLAYGAISLMTAVLNTARRFSAPAFTPILNNVVAIGILLAFAAVGHTHSLSQVQHDRHLLLLLGVGTTLGVVVQAVALIPSVLSCGLRIRPRWRPDDPAVREIVRLSGWTFGFVIANQVAVFVVSAVAVSIGAATLTAYTYASTFFQLPFGIVAVSVMTTIAPVLSSRFTRGDTAGFAEQFGLGLRRTLAGVIPAVVGYLLLARPAISLISLGAGTAHHSSGAHLTATMLELLALGLPGFCVYLLAILAFQSMRDTRTPFFLYLLENGLNIVLAFGLRSTLGGRGLALSLAIAYTVAAVAALARACGREWADSVASSWPATWPVPSSARSSWPLWWPWSSQASGRTRASASSNGSLPQSSAGWPRTRSRQDSPGPLLGWQTSKRRLSDRREGCSWPG